MLSTAVIDEVRRMLREGRLSQRGIAARTGVSRGTVNAIALGKRPDRPARQVTSDHGFLPPSGLPVRCPGCGGRVQMPCLLCYVRSVRRQRNSSGR